MNHYGISFKRISLEELIRLASISTTKPGPRRVRTVEILDLIINRKRTIEEVAEEYQVSRRSIELTLRRCGVTVLKERNNGPLHAALMYEASRLRRLFTSLEDFISFLRIQADMLGQRKKT